VVPAVCLYCACSVCHHAGHFKRRKRGRPQHAKAHGVAFACQSRSPSGGMFNRDCTGSYQTSSTMNAVTCVHGMGVEKRETETEIDREREKRQRRDTYRDTDRERQRQSRDRQRDGQREGGGGEGERERVREERRERERERKEGKGREGKKRGGGGKGSEKKRTRNSNRHATRRFRRSSNCAKASGRLEIPTKTFRRPLPFKVSSYATVIMWGHTGNGVEQRIPCRSWWVCV